MIRCWIKRLNIKRNYIKKSASEFKTFSGKIFQVLLNDLNFNTSKLRGESETSISASLRIYT